MFMDIKILNDQDTHIELLLKNFDLALVNSLKRICGEEVKTMAIEEVDFYQYNGVLPMEMVAHRIGLIPITCESANMEQVFFDLNIKAEEDGYTVYSGDLISNDSNVKPVYDKMPIIKLNKNQVIRLKARAIWSNGLDHYKWSPVCPATFKNVNKAEENNDTADFIFSIDTTGSLSPKRVFTDALKILYNNLEGFLDKI